MKSRKTENYLTFLDLCRRPDGREDHDILNYKTSTECIGNCLLPRIPPTTIIGIKGIGKSTAFKILTNSSLKNLMVTGFAPGAERFRALPHVQPGLYRERFYVIFLITIIALMSELDELSVN